jgi:hypothetical protein
VVSQELILEPGINIRTEKTIESSRNVVGIKR